MEGDSGLDRSLAATSLALHAKVRLGQRDMTLQDALSTHKQIALDATKGRIPADRRDLKLLKAFLALDASADKLVDALHKFEIHHGPIASALPSRGLPAALPPSSSTLALVPSTRALVRETATVQPGSPQQIATSRPSALASLTPRHCGRLLVHTPLGQWLLCSCLVLLIIASPKLWVFIAARFFRAAAAAVTDMGEELTNQVAQEATQSSASPLLPWVIAAIAWFRH